MTATSHQFTTLSGENPVVQRAKVRAWLEAGGVDVRTVDRVRLERRRLRLDPDGGAPFELDRTTILELIP